VLLAIALRFKPFIRQCMKNASKIALNATFKQK